VLNKNLPVKKPLREEKKASPKNIYYLHSFFFFFKQIIGEAGEKIFSLKVRNKPGVNFFNFFFVFMLNPRKKKKPMFLPNKT